MRSLLNNNETRSQIPDHITWSDYVGFDNEPKSIITELTDNLLEGKTRLKITPKTYQLLKKAKVLNMKTVKKIAAVFKKAFSMRRSNKNTRYTADHITVREKPFRKACIYRIFSLCWRSSRPILGRIWSEDEELKCKIPYKCSCKDNLKLIGHFLKKANPLE